MILTFNSSPSLRRDLSDDLVTSRPCNFLLILAKSLSKTRDTLQYVDKETVSSAEASSMVHLWISSELVNNQKRQYAVADWGSEEALTINQKVPIGIF